MNRAAATAAPAMPGAEELARVSDELNHNAHSFLYFNFKSFPGNWGFAYSNKVLSSFMF